jgi:hypothetical protein
MSDTGLPTPKKRREDHLLAEAYSHLESEICDVKNVSLVLETVIESALHKPEHREGWRIFTLTEEQMNSVMFIVYQVGDLARTLHEKYYAGFEEEDSDD